LVDWEAEGEAIRRKLVVVLWNLDSLAKLPRDRRNHGETHDVRSNGE